MYSLLEIIRIYYTSFWRDIGYFICVKFMPKVLKGGCIDGCPVCLGFDVILRCLGCKLATDWAEAWDPANPHDNAWGWGWQGDHVSFHSAPLPFAQDMTSSLQQPTIISSPNLSALWLPLCTENGVEDILRHHPGGEIYLLNGSTGGC